MGIEVFDHRLLLLSPVDFPSIVAAAMENLIFMFENLRRSRLDRLFVFPLQNDLKTCDMLSTFIPIIFSTNKDLQDKGTLALLYSWIVFPPTTVDISKTAPMYSLLYSLTWIFTRILGKSMNSDTVRKC